MKDLTCPYCGHEREACDIHEPERLHEVECSKCEKNFGVEVEYWPSYTMLKLPCANGEPHKWVKIVGVPDWHFVDKYHCEYCGEKRIFKDGIPKEEENVRKI